MELTIPFLWESDYVKASKYGMVIGVYIFHICFKGYRGISMIVEGSGDLKEWIGWYIDK